MNTALTMLISAMLAIWTGIGVAIVFWAISEYLKKGKKLEMALEIGLLYFVLTMMLIGVLTA